MDEQKPRKELILQLHGEQRTFGTVELACFNDISSIVELLRRGRSRYDSRISRERVDAAEIALATAGVYQSFDQVEKKLKEWKQNKFEIFDADVYYDKDRSTMYHQHNGTGAQVNLARAAIGMMDSTQAVTSGSKLVLDIGAGTGLSSAGMRKCRPDWFVIGLDASSHMLEHATASNAPCLDTIRADMSQPLPFRDGVFDHCASIAALHYILEPSGTRSGQHRAETCISETIRCMENCVTTPNMAVFQLFPTQVEKLNVLHEGYKNYLEKHPGVSVNQKLVMDQPHHNQKPRWYYCLWKSSRIVPVVGSCVMYLNQEWPENFSPCCPLLLGTDCMTQAFESPGSQHSDPVREHLGWQVTEHVKYARKIMRTMAHMARSNASSQHANMKKRKRRTKDALLLPQETALAQRLISRYAIDGKIPELQQLLIDARDVCNLLHGGEAS